MGRILGLDGGGTKTDVVVADSTGKVLARQRWQGVDPTVGDGWEVTLCDIAKGLGPVQTAVLGLPYHGEIADVSARQTALATRLFGPQSMAMNDVAVAFEGALGGVDGVLVLAGTGSMAWSRGPLGEHRVGGWGDVFGDEGSAYWIGREALARMSRELDGRCVQTGFSRDMLARMGIGAADLMHWTYGLKSKRAGIARLASLVSDLARNGNDDAIALMTITAQHLAKLGLTAARLCGAPLHWSFAGGVMSDPMVMKILTELMGITPARPVLPPVGGAVLAAAKAAGWNVGPEFITTLRAGLNDPTNVTGIVEHANDH